MSRLLKAAVAMSMAFSFGACGPQQEDEASPGGRSVISTSTQGLTPTPLTGGNLAVVQDGKYAVVSDPDHNKVWVANLETQAVAASLDFPRGSLPTHIIEGADHMVHVALRGTGQLARISLDRMTVADVQPVCPEPRGMVFDPPTRRLMVACASGELVTQHGDGVTEVQLIKPDLRDVLIRNGKIYVTTFRKAELIPVDQGQPLSGPPVASGTLAPLPAPTGTGLVPNPTTFEPTVAWRTVTNATGDLFMVHQYEANGDIMPPHTSKTTQPPTGSSTTTPPKTGTSTPAYGGSSRGGCETSVVRSAVTSIVGGVRRTTVFGGVLPVDLAVSPDGRRIVVPTPGNLGLVTIPTGGGSTVPSLACSPAAREAEFDDVTGLPRIKGNQIISVGFTADSRLVTLSRDPLQLNLEVRCARPGSTCSQQVIKLTDSVVDSSGFTTFHTAPNGVACASCHPEAGDDGHTWKIAGKNRRTMNLTGGVMDTAPFHWPGDLATMASVMNDTFVGRMGGTIGTGFDRASLESFLQKVPARKVTVTADPATLERGHAVFDAAGCGGCHAGKALTMPESVDVGTGERLQVPSLRGVGMRAPYMHDGCAKTLEERFTNQACGGINHGNVSQLTVDDMNAMVSYLKTL